MGELIAPALVDPQAACINRMKALLGASFHDGGVIGIGHHRVLRVQALGVADHGKQALVLRHAIDDEVGVENLVPAVLAVGLGKHHELDIGGVAPQAGEGLHQIVDFIGRQRQALRAISLLERRPTAAKHVNRDHGRAGQFIEQRPRLFAAAQHAFGHAVVQQVGQTLALIGAQAGSRQQTALENQSVFSDPLDPTHRQAAVVGDVGGLGSPGRDRAQAGGDHEQGPLDERLRKVGAGLAVTEQTGQPLVFVGLERLRRCHQVHVTGMQAADAIMNRLKPGQKLLNAEIAQGADARRIALEKVQVQGHVGQRAWAQTAGRGAGEKTLAGASTRL